jgi:hypothetical protein
MFRHSTGTYGIEYRKIKHQMRLTKIQYQISAQLVCQKLNIYMNMKRREVLLGFTTFLYQR